MNKQRYYLDQTDNGLLGPAIAHIYRELDVVPNSKILDMGCGAGYLASFKPKHINKIHLCGLDIDKYAKKNIRLGYEQIVIRDVEARDYRLPQFKNSSFDYIVAKDFLEHILKPWKIIPEFYRILKPGGKVWAQVPHYTSQLAWIDYTHVRPFTKHSLNLMFKDSGFAISMLKYNSLGGLKNPQLVDYLLNKLPLFGHFAGNIEITAIKKK